jgi:Protein of unknown function (DUF3866)
MTLSLLRGVVAAVERGDEATIEMTVAVDREERPALAFRDLTGEVEPGDDVVVNTAALELGLGSGGFDVLHVNLTRGLGADPDPSARTMKLNYTPLQHGVVPIEAGEADGDPVARRPRTDGRPVAVLALHGQLEPVAWAAARTLPEARVGFVQTAGGALPGGLSRAVRELRRRSLLDGHVTAAPCFGGEREAVTVAGALVAGFEELGWDAAIVGPGPGIVGSASALGHGGLAALDSAHASIALGARTVLVPRMSSGDSRPRHRGLSHHSATVAELLLRRVVVAVPSVAPNGTVADTPLARHELRTADVDLEAYRASGLTSETMGRSIEEDGLFFSAALAGGVVLGEEIDRKRASHV